MYTAASCIRGVHHDLRPGFFKARLAWRSMAGETKDPDATYISVVFILSNLSLPVLLGG